MRRIFSTRCSACRASFVEVARAFRRPRDPAGLKPSATITKASTQRVPGGLVRNNTSYPVTVSDWRVIFLSTPLTLYVLRLPAGGLPKKGLLVSDTSFEQQVERDFRWNFSVNLVDISFIMLGLSLVSRDTVIPLLMSKLTTSPVVIGLISAVYSLGFYLPQLLGASVAEGMPRKKPFVTLVGGLGERVPFLIIGLAVLLLAGRRRRSRWWRCWRCLCISGASAGFATPAWFDMIAKVIPQRRRGLFTGLGHGLGALMGVAGAVVIGVVLDRWPYPQNFALLFVLAFVSMAISWAGLALNREPANPSVHPSFGLAHYLRRLPGILRQDRNFARYIIAMAVARAGTMAERLLPGLWRVALPCGRRRGRPAHRRADRLPGAAESALGHAGRPLWA